MTVKDVPLLLHVFPSFSAGGAQIRMVQLANGLGSSYRHAIVALDGDTDCASRLDPALEVTVVPRPDTARGLGGRLLAIRRALRRLRPDLLITSNWGSIEWALANRIPLVPHIHMEDGFGVEERDRQLPRRVITRRVALGRSFVVVPSRTLERIALSQWHLPRDRLVYVPNGVDLQRFAPAERQQSGLPVIGCVAGLRAEKNVSRLLEASRYVAETCPHRLLIVGDGPERAALEAQAARLDLDARFAGVVADPAPLYREMDVFCLTSDTEQMPISVMEAMASSLPLVTTRVGDIAEMATVENRPYLAERNAESVAACLRALLQDEALRDRLGVANRARAESEFGDAQMIATWERIFAQCLRR